MSHSLQDLFLSQNSFIIMEKELARINQTALGEQKMHCENETSNKHFTVLNLSNLAATDCFP